jgi:iron complex outermembrane recepter protein
MSPKGLITAVIMGFLPIGAVAQGVLTTESTTAPAPEIEKIEVTGSRIRRLEVEGPSPVQTVTRKDIEKSGYNSVSDVLRDTSGNSFGSAREASGGNAAGVSHVDLRGLGASNTLVLLNGQRLPTDAVTGAVDISLIPMAAVERIEILKDGASAIYGSDALGGVVNIITRRDFSGSEISLDQSTPELTGGIRQNLSLVNGMNRGRLNMVNVVQYRKNEQVFSRDREWTNNGISTIGAAPAFRNPGGQWQVDSQCPADSVNHTPGQGDFCNFKYSDYSSTLPQLEQLSLLSEANVEINSRVKVTVRAGGTQKKGQWQFAPAPGNFTMKGGDWEPLMPGGVAPPGLTAGQDLQVRYRVMELGPRRSEFSSTSFNLLAGTTIQLNRGWMLDVTASHNRVDGIDRGVSGYALTKKLTDLIESGQVNIFNPGAGRGSLDSAKYVPEEKTMSMLTSTEIKGSGELGQLSGGAIGMAIGTTYTEQKYEDNFDEQSVNNKVYGNAGSSGGGRRNSVAAYSELGLPITRKVELQLASRYDRYSDFGDTFNPKLAIVYRPITQLMFRGSAGTGFKAPLMQDLYAGKSIGYPSMIDTTACRKEQKTPGPTPSCDPQQIEVRSGGNTNLKEERSVSFNVGTVFEPSKSFNIGADFFVTKMNNVVGIDYDDALLAEADGIPVKDYGFIVHRDANDYIEYIDAPQQNLSARDVTGINLTSGLQAGKLRLGVDHSIMLSYMEQGFPGTARKNRLGDNGRPVWRNAASVSFLPTERQDVTVAAISTAGQAKSVKERGNLTDYTSYDVMYSYKSKSLGTITAGVKNVLGTTPPIDDSDITTPLNTALYDQIGRQVYTAYKMTF